MDVQGLGKKTQLPSFLPMSLNAALLSDNGEKSTHLPPATLSEGFESDEEAGGGIYASTMPKRPQTNHYNDEPLLQPLDVEADEPKWSRRKKAGVGVVATLLMLSAITAVVLAFVVPTIVQSTIDQTDITFGENSVGNADGSQFVLGAEIDIKCDGALGSTLNPTPLSFSYQDVPVGTATLPSITTTPGTTLYHQSINELFTLHDATLEGWNLFNTDLIRADNVTWHISATPTVTIHFGLFDLDYTAKLEKDIVMLGLGGLKQFEIVTFDVQTPADSEHAYFDIEARLFNPSMTSVTPLGAISLEALTGSASKLGFIRAENVSIVPGWNSLKLAGPVIPDSLDEMNAAMSSYFVGKPVDVLSRMNDITFDGVTYPACDNKLFEAGMVGLTMGPAILQQEHQNLTKHALSNTLVGTTDLALFNPLSADLKVAHLDMHVNYDGVHFARIHEDLDTDIGGGDTVVAAGVRLNINEAEEGELNVVEEITADMMTLVPKPGSGVAPEDCSALLHVEGKCEYKGYFCLGCDGNMTVHVADLVLTLAYWQEENFPVCESEGSFDQAACQYMENGGANLCLPSLRGRKDE